MVTGEWLEKRKMSSCSTACKKTRCDSHNGKIASQEYFEAPQHLNNSISSDRFANHLT